MNSRFTLVLIGAFCIACGSRAVSSGGPDAETGPTKDVSGSTETLPPWDPGTSDGVPPGKTTISQVQASSASVQCATDGISNPSTGLQMADIVVVSPRFVASWDKNTNQPKLHGYYVAEAGLATSAEFKGILMVVDAAKNTDFPPGRVLSVTADHTEYYCMSELKVTAFQELGNATVPAPLELPDVSILENGGTAGAEPYEGVLVTLHNVPVTHATASDGKGWFEAGNGIQVVNDFDLQWTPTVGTTLGSLTGAIKYHFGKYRIVPRSLDDLSEGPGPGPDAIEPSPEVIVADGEVIATKGKVFDIQSSDSSVHCTNEGNNTIQTGVEIGPVVVTTPMFSASANLDGFYVSDFPVGGAVSYTGILVVVSKTAGIQVAPGDEVVVAGDYKEYYCFSEISAKSVQKTGQQPAPAGFPVTDLGPFENGGTADAEPDEGVLITLKDVVVTATTSSDGKGWFRVGNGIEILNDFQVNWTPTVGVELASLTGVVKYHWGKYRIVPRSVADIVLKSAAEPSPEPVPEPMPEPTPDAFEVSDAPAQDVPATKKTILQLQAAEASVNCTQEGNLTIASGVALADVVVVSPQHSASASLHGYYVQDPVSSWPLGSNGKYTGMLLVVPKSLGTNFQPGDLISVVGDYKEYYCMTEISATSAVKVGTANVPDPLGVAATAFENGGTANVCEPYEGLRVTITDVSVTNTTGGTNPKWWFQVGNGIYIADDYGLAASFTPTAGQTFSHVTGAVKYSYGKYLLVPFTAADIQTP